MHQDEFCRNFDLLEFIKENSESLNPFALERADKTVFFRDVGVIEFQPKKHSHQYLVLSAGIHGNETAPIEMLAEIVKDLLADKNRLSLNLLIIIGNPKALLKEERFIGFNLNRLFNKNWESYLSQTETEYEGRRAKTIEHHVDRFFVQETHGVERYHYDLHTAIKPSLHHKFAIYPFLGERKHNHPQLQFLLDAGIDTVLIYHKPSTTFSYFSSHNYHACSFTLELGKVKPFGQNDPNDFLQTKQRLVNLISGKYKFAGDPDFSSMNIYQVKKELIKEKDLDRLAFDSALANFTQFDKGQLLLDAGSNSYLTEQDGEAIVFPNDNVPVGQRMGLVVIKTPKL